MEVTCYVQSFDIYFPACEVYFNLRLNFYLIHIAYMYNVVFAIVKFLL
jgi:hypothetical protein